MSFKRLTLSSDISTFYGFTLNRMIHRNMDSLSIKVDGEKDIVLMKKLREGFKNKKKKVWNFP